MGFKKSLFITLIFLNISCSEQLLSTSIVTSNNTNASKGTCSAVDQKTLAARINKLNQDTTTAHLQQSQKFDINDFTDSMHYSVQNSEDTLLPISTQVIVAVKRLCALQNSKSLPDENLKQQLIKTKNPEMMAEQSLLWKLPKPMKISELKNIALNSDCITGVSLNKSLDLLSVQNTLPNDTYFNNLTHLKAVGYEYLYNKFINFPENITTTVAVIDTGNDLVHADMVGRNWENLKEKNGTPGVDDDGNGFIDDINGWNFDKNIANVTDEFGIPHGEHVAGLIAANVNNNVGVAGIASNKVKIMHLNVFGASHLPGFGTQDPLVLMENAIRYAADNGAKVINLSVGRVGSSITAFNALNYAVQKGVFIAAAAGNNYEEITAQKPFFPAVYAVELPGMMAVGALDSFNGVLNAKCGFSNFSTQYVEITAPGCDTKASESGLLSLGIFSESPYVYMAGTSMASPLVAGAAALISNYIQERSGVVPSNILVKKILKSGGKKMALQEAYVQNGNVLELPSIFNYIDTEILQLPISCR